MILLISVVYLVASLATDAPDTIPWWLRNVTKATDIRALNYPNNVNWSVTSSYIGNWSISADAMCTNCTGILRLKTAKGAKGTPLGVCRLSIYDLNFTFTDYQTAIYNEYFDKNTSTRGDNCGFTGNSKEASITVPWNTTRTLKIVIQIFDGSYESDAFHTISAIGYYFPERQRCVAKGILYQIFRTPKFSSNETELEELKKEVLDDSKLFPPTENISTFDPGIEESIANRTARISKSKCSFDIWITKDYKDRPYTSEYFYTPDTEASLAYRDYYVTIADSDGNRYNTSDPSEIAEYYLKKVPPAPYKTYILRPATGPDYVKVPSYKLHLFSKDCAVNMTFEGVVSNEASGIKVGLIFFVGLIILLLCSFFAGVYQQVVITSGAQIRRVSAAAVYMLTISAMTHSVSLIAMGSLFQPLDTFFIVTGVLSFLEAIIMHIPLCIIKFNAWYIARHGVPSIIYMLLFLISLVLLSALPVIWGLFLPFYINIITVIIMLSHWPIQFAFRCVMKFANSPIRSSYIVFNTLPKVYTAAYILGFPISFLNLEAKAWLMWCVLGYGTVVCLLLILQNSLGHDLGLSRLCCRKRLTQLYSNVYRYNGTIIPEEVLHDSDARDTFALQSEMSDGLGIVDYVATLSTPFLIPFAPASVTFGVFPGSDVEPLAKADSNMDKSEIQIQGSSEPGFITSHSQLCMNPYHSHSIFYNPSLPFTKLFNAKLCPWMLHLASEDLSVDPSVLSECTNCFYITDISQHDTQIMCSICLDDIVLPHLANFEILQIFKPEISLFHKEHNILSSTPIAQWINYGNEATDNVAADANSTARYELWITPCHHCFHRDCLLKWIEQNLTCPIDRKPIPEYVACDG